MLVTEQGYSKHTDGVAVDLECFNLVVEDSCTRSTHDFSETIDVVGIPADQQDIRNCIDEPLDRFVEFRDFFIEPILIDLVQIAGNQDKVWRGIDQTVYCAALVRTDLGRLQIGKHSDPYILAYAFNL